jgi:hypothetical protein
MAAPYNPPKKNEDFYFYSSFELYAQPGVVAYPPTIVTGDFKISIDGGSLANLTYPPANPGGYGGTQYFYLTSDEMNGDVITIVGIDQTRPKNWADFFLCILTTQ